MARAPFRRLRRALSVVFVIGAVLAILTPGGSGAAPRPEMRGSVGRPSLVAPALGQRWVESEVRFAFAVPSGWRADALVLSTQPFESSAWTEIPSRPELHVVPADRPVLSLAGSGLRIDSETTLWWCVTARDPGTGRLVASETRSFVVLPKFANRVAPTLRLPEPSLIAGVAPDADATAGPARIRLAAGFDFAPSEGEPSVPGALATESAPAGVTAGAALRSALVQFDGPPTAADREALVRSGAAVFAYVPDHAFLVRVRDDARPGLAALAHVAWLGDYKPAYKLSPLVSMLDQREQGYEALLFPDADLPSARGRLERLGLAVDGAWQNGVNKLVRLRATAARLPDVAGLSDVAWIEPVIPMRVDNDLAQWVVQTNVNGSRRVWDMGIRGQGQIVTTSDTGIKTTHDQFRDNAVPITAFGDFPTHRKIIAYQRGSLNPKAEFGDTSADSYHGTHTAGTICGNDDPVGGVSLRDGMAKDAKIYFMDIGGLGLNGFVDPFPDLNDLFLPAYTGNAAGGARLSSNSWGGTVAGAYTLYSYMVDQFVWTHPDFYVTFSTGNSNPNSPTPTPGLVGTPATAKDCAGAGGTQNGTQAANIYNRTSRGPTADGRRKPTLASPGQSVTSAFGTTNSSYAALSGTSMASPSQTGAVALMRQYCTDGWYPTGSAVAANDFAPSAALLKAMAINSADMTMTGFTAPDQSIGYGRVDADNVLYFAGDARKLLLVDQTEGLTQGQALEYPVYVSDASIPLKVSLCWSDYLGNPAAAIQIVNDLDLTVSQGATEYRGNVFSGGVSVTGGSYDHVNVEEEVLVPAPVVGLWTVRVSAPTAPMGPQPFGLCVTGGVGNGAASLALDRAQYGSSGTVELQVTDGNAGGSVQVAVSSNTESTPEMVTLAGANGIYTGTLTLTPTTTGPSDGELAVSEGDLLTAVYQDASPSATLTATAPIGFDTPLIDNVHAGSPSQGAALVSWNTDRAADSKVYYGLTPALELGSVTVPGGTLAHSVWITGLTPGSTYYYDVQSTSLTGSVARDNAGGDHRQVTVKGRGEALLLFNEEPFGRGFPWEDALAANGVDYDKWTGALAETPLVGDKAAGLRAYEAVLWDAGMETYPPISDVQRTAIDSYLNGGGRLAMCGHDILWGMGAPESPTTTPARVTWLTNTLHASYLSDLATFAQVLGTAADPVSGNFTGGVSYAPMWIGAGGDECVPQNGAVLVWQTDGLKNVGVRWESTVPQGSADSAAWGGQTSRLVDLFFEFGNLTPPHSTPNATRNDVLDKTLDWLLGRDRPTVAVTFPNGGESITTGSVNIAWTEGAALGRTIVDRSIEVSYDNGGSWTTLAAHAGPSPYPWDASAVPNGAATRVRVRVTDDGTPAFSAADQSNAVFALARPGGDGKGPRVVAGSIAVSPNPLVRPAPATLSARVTDLETGNGGVAAAEWSFGVEPEPAGSGTPLSGSFGGATVDVTGSLDTTPFLTGSRTLWVRGRDAGGNWGPASALAVVVNGTPLTGVEPAPRVLELSPGAPNPFHGRVSMSFGLPRDASVEIAVFDVRGKLVRGLASGAYPAGRHVASWDGLDRSGRPAPAGVYWCRLTTVSGRIERRLVRL